METKGYYCVYKTLPLVPILSQKLPVHTFSPQFLKIHSKPRSYEWSIFFRFPTKILYVFFLAPSTWRFQKISSLSSGVGDRNGNI